jgi:Arc/MetJ family transcription regulator
MTRMMMEIDEDLLAQAAAIFGTTTKRATVETALRAATSKQARRRLAERMAAANITDHRQLRQQAWRAAERGSAEGTS